MHNLHLQSTALGLSEILDISKQNLQCMADLLYVP